MGYLDNVGLAHLWGKVKGALTDKQDKLTGLPGQVVGFDGMGLAYAVPGWCNPNLLDNWYFADPINQRGQTEYNSNNIHTIDRWYVVNNCKVTINDGYVTIQNTGEWAYFIQRLEPKLLDAIRGKNVTISVLTASGELKFVTTQIDDNNTGADSVKVGAWMLDFYTGFLRFFIINNDKSSLSLVAAKLELGPIQTLAHQDEDGNWVLNDPPPDKALELAKCQRYQWVSTFPMAILGYAFDSTTAYAPISMPVSMRAKPSAVALYGNFSNFMALGIGRLSNITVQFSGSLLELVCTVSGGGLTPGNAYRVIGYDGGARLLLDANL